MPLPNSRNRIMAV